MLANDQGKKERTPVEEGGKIEIGAACEWPHKAVERDRVGPRWHVVQGQLDGIRRLKECRSGLEAETYSPMIRTMQPVPRKQLSAKQRKSLITIKRPVLKQLFPGYFFIRFDRRHDRWHEIFKLVGIYGMICEGDTPAPFPDGLLESLRANEVDGALPGKITLEQLNYKLGETVRVSHGPFIGFKAIVEELPNAPIEELDEDTRVRLLVSIFGRECSVATPILHFGKL